jgi:hypothetical protein
VCLLQLPNACCREIKAERDALLSENEYLREKLQKINALSKVEERKKKMAAEPKLPFPAQRSKSDLSQPAMTSTLAVV